ncbi:MAG: PRC-barrel domain-containing protein [Dethiobacter sp.]|jgi:uncharacterized protein YrrD|nr:PRC-barrel domain-containing protein [Dethiobacter sp.]
MRFSRDVTGIPVIHAQSGKELGRVREWLLDGKGEYMLAFLVEGVGWLPQTKIIPFGQVVGLGDDAVIVHYDEAQLSQQDTVRREDTCSVLGKRVLNSAGNEIGVVEDMLFDESSGRVAGWRLSSGLIEDLLSGRQVLELPTPLTMGEDVLIIRD